MVMKKLLSLAFIVTSLIFFAITLGTRVYQMHRDDIQDLHKYRGYLARYYSSLVVQIQKDESDVDARSRLAEGLYACGVYDISGDLFEQIYHLSGQKDKASKSKSDRCRFMHFINKGNRINSDMLDIEEMNRLCPKLLSSGSKNPLL
jgi:hypothetical protein